MEQKQSWQNKTDDLTRRDFMRDGAITAASLAVGLGTAGGKNAFADGVVRNIPSYNPDMEYRRLGKTNIWISAVCLGDTGSESIRWCPVFLQQRPG